jgi:UDP-N-acetylmuramoylalanine--D-glutamate ligase
MAGDWKSRPRFPYDLRGKSIIVLGAGQSGRAAAALLARNDAHVTLADDNPTAVDPNELEKTIGTHVRLVLGDVRPGLASTADAIVTSPGVPSSHPLLTSARDSGIPIIGELELGSRFARAPMIAVTGTNGKTTTVRWIAHLLGKGGRTALACGNIGTALCDVVNDRPDWFVVEVSSYQLETIERFHPRVAAILNLAPDHLDRHPSAHEYLAIKARIGANQQPDDALVLNADDSAVWSLSFTASATVWGFSLVRPPGRGVFIEGGKIQVKQSDRAAPKALLETNQLSLPGSHNLANALAAVAVAWVCGVKPEEIAAGLQDFPGVEHRIERVREWRGVTFINDSKATNLSSLEVALCSFDRPIILIAGGRGKGAPYEPLVPLIKAHVRHLIVLGEDAEDLQAAWGDHVPAKCVDSMEEAVLEASQVAQAGDVVLLSPACASFDMYNNYEERGRHFRKLVMSLSE